MKSVVSLVLALFLLNAFAFGQFKTNLKDEPSVSQSLVRSDDSGLLFGWFDPGKLKMAQSYSLSYQTFGRQGLALGAYTNSLSYQISNPLSVQMDVSVVHSPYSSLGGDFSKSLSGIYLSRAELNYKASDNMLFQVQYRQMPASLYYGGYGFGGSYWGLDHY